MPFSSEIACFFEQALIKKCSFIWKNNAGNISEESIKMWQILVMTELVCTQGKHTNMQCFMLWNACGLTLARLERGDDLTGIGDKGVGLKAFVHPLLPPLCYTPFLHKRLYGLLGMILYPPARFPQINIFILSSTRWNVIHSDILSEATKWNIFSSCSWSHFLWRRAIPKRNGSIWLHYSLKQLG